MKYILMCGGDYPKFEVPRQLLKVNGEVIIERTIRLLRENGITDIAVSSNNPAFRYLDVEIITDDSNKYVYGDKNENTKAVKSWLQAYTLENEPTCYLHGDVYFSEDAIKRIINKPVENTMFICIPDKQDIPNKDKRNIKGREPVGYKVVNYQMFNASVLNLLQMINDGKFKDAIIKPISWTVYRYINGLDLGYNAKSYNDLNDIFKSDGDYMIINDYTTDIDFLKDIKELEEVLKNEENRKAN